MEGHREASGERQPEPRVEDRASDTRTLTILRRYAAGDISSRQAAKELGPTASEHDVFAGIIAAGLPLPEPPAVELAREVAALRALYGPPARD